MSLSESVAEITGDVCGVISREFGHWCEKVTRKVLDFPCYPSMERDENGKLKEVKINCPIPLDKIEDTYEKVLKWLEEDVNTDEGQKITMDMIEGIYKDKGLDVGTGRLIVEQVTPNDDPPLRFRATYNFSVSKGYRGGFPNFHKADHGDGIVYGTILLNSNFAEWRNVSAEELGNPTDIGDRFRAVNTYAGSHGFIGGFPNFHQADYGNGVVYGVILLKTGTGDQRDVSAEELGNPTDIGDRFRAVHNYANSKGFSAAFPNFHQADHGNGTVYGTILINNTAADRKDIEASVLFPPEIKVNVVKRRPSQPPAVPYEEPRGDRYRPWNRT